MIISFPRQPRSRALSFDAPPNLRRFACATGLAALLLAVLAPLRADAHDAKSGWSYPFSCCSNYDCRKVPAASISERPAGYVIENTGEVVAHNDTRLRFSPDGEYHWCSVAGETNSRTICLFVPPRAY